MDPLDHLRALPDGMRCTVCEERVPVTRLRILARREDLAVIQLDCPACDSTTLGFSSAGSLDGDGPVGRGPITADDVLDMHAFLSDWQGDLTTLVRHGPGASGGRRDAAPDATS